MLSSKEEIQKDVKELCKNREDTTNYLAGWLKYFNASKAKKKELQITIEEIKWILEAANEIPTGVDKFLGVRK